jgi:hypothetical protein
MSVRVRVTYRVRARLSVIFSTRPRARDSISVRLGFD